MTVFAASSLTEVFTQIAEAFTEDTGARVTLVFGPSSRLVAQVLQGAPADVVAAADTMTMAALVDADRAVDPPVAFATNRLAILVEAGNPMRIRSLADLARAGVVYLAANPEVPIGRYTDEVLTRAGVRATPRSLEADVKALVTKVALGEADAAIVYATDVRAGGTRVAGVPIPDSDNVVATYPAVVATGAPHPELATRFVAFLTSAAGRSILADHGFGAP